jgi:hypothetical protein
VLIIAPLALYPAYRATAADPALGEYAREYISLPFQPNGPVWFLWPLLALSLLPPALRAFAPSVVAGLARLSSRAGESPGKYLVGLGTAATLAYVPLALIFTPWSWNEHGPFSIQLSRPLFYAVFYVAGVGVGAHGLARGLLKPDGAFARRWNVWLGCAVAMVALWMTFTALTLDPARANSIALQLGADVGFAAAGTAGFFFATAACLRFAAVRNAFFDGLSKNALGIYALHYAPLVWLQYAMTGFAGFAGVKAAIVFAGTLLASIAAAAALRRVPHGSRLIGESSGGQAA